MDNGVLRRRILLVGLALFLIPSATIIARAASYSFNLPNNVIFADDFNSYTNGLQVGCWGATGLGSTGGKNGWGCNDSATTGNANITGQNFLSCCQSMATWSTTTANGLFDIEKKLGLPSNSTTMIGISVWVAFNRSYTNQQGNNAHLSIETFDSAQRYEGAIFLFSKINPLGNGCNVVRGVSVDFQTTPTAGGSAVDTYSNICLATWGQINGGGGSAGGFWHHFYWVVNIITHQWVTAQVDGMDFTSLVAGQYMPPHAGGDTTHNGFYTPHSFLFEIGAGNGVSHTSTTDDWVAWHDDLIITDAGGNLPNPVFSNIFNMLYVLGGMAMIAGSVVGYKWILMDLEGHGTSHAGIMQKKDILKGLTILLVGMGVIAIIAGFFVR